MSKVYKTNLVEGVFHQWTISKAYAEIIQNWLDSDGKQEISWGEDSITLKNLNIKVSSKVLLMGLSDKRNDSGKLGFHGIGLIQALAVLTYNNVNVVIKNNDVVWTPSFEYDETYDHNVLVFTETLADHPDEHYSVGVTGLSEEDIDEIKQRTLCFQDREVFFTTKYGDVIENPEDGCGEIFCGGLYVCQNNGFKYSYNISPELLVLTTERNAVDNWEMKKLTAKIWRECPDKELLKEAIDSKAEDCSLVMDSWYTSDYNPLSVSEEYGEEFTAKYANHLVTSDHDEYEQLTKCGNKVKYIDNSNKVKAIQESKAYKTMKSSLDVIEVESNSTKLSRICLAFEQLIYDNDHEDVTYEGFTMQEHLDVLNEIINEI